MTSGFEITSMILTSCRTYLVLHSQIVLPCFSRSADKLSAECCVVHFPGAVIECFLGCLGQLIPLPSEVFFTGRYGGNPPGRMGDFGWVRPPYPLI